MAADDWDGRRRLETVLPETPRQSEGARQERVRKCPDECTCPLGVTSACTPQLPPLLLI